MQTVLFHIYKIYFQNVLRIITAKKLGDGGEVNEAKNFCFIHKRIFWVS